MDLRVLKRILELNARRSFNPLGFSEKNCGKWANGLEIPEKGENVLYTGCLYQMIPRIRAFSELLRRLESVGQGVLDFAMGLEKVMLSLGLDPSGFLQLLNRGEDKRYLEILKRIAVALKEAGVEFAYLREEPYNGVLYHDLGMDYLFDAQAKRVASKLREAGAKRVITVDPHSTYMLRYLIGEYVDGFDVEVIHYTEVLEASGFSPKLKEGAEVTLHDPCYLARWNNIIEQPRRLLERAGFTLREPEFTRGFTGCCGGPIESLMPMLSYKIAEKRFEELASTGSNCIVTLCPICLANLEKESKRSGIRVLDLAEVIL